LHDNLAYIENQGIIGLSRCAAAEPKIIGFGHCTEKVIRLSLNGWSSDFLILERIIVLGPIERMDRGKKEKKESLLLN
jgi:hypothetical protein